MSDNSGVRLYKFCCIGFFLYICNVIVKSKYRDYKHLFYTLMFLAHLAQSPCEILPSVGVRPLTFDILIFSFETTGPNGTKLGRKHLCKVLYKVSSLRPVPPTNMATKGNSYYWLATVKKIFSSETAWSNGANLDRKHLCKALYKVSSFRSAWPANMAAKSNSCFWLANVKQIFSSETSWPN